MLKFLFHRDSKMIVIMEVISILGSAVILNSMVNGRMATLSIMFFTLNQGIYLFVKYCSLKRWHANPSKTAGIGLHFKKTLVATSYILAISNWSYILTMNSWVLVAASFVLIFVSHVNVILIAINRRQTGQRPANFLSKA